MRFSGVSSISSGTTFLPCLASDICNSGCTASNQSTICLSSTSGLHALASMLKTAFARIKSISAKNSYEERMAGTCGRTIAENSVRMRIISRRSSPSNSRIRLFASTTSAGSIKTVLPVADSSCTIPLIFRFMPGATGITSRPSRIVGVTSLSTYPSDCAARRMLFKLRDMLPVVADSSRRIRSNSAAALSFIFPNLSRILFILVISCGKVIISPANSLRAG